MRRLLLAALAALPLSALAQSPSAPASRIEQRVNSILARMTLGEKIHLIAGTGLFDIGGVPRLGVPPMVTANGTFGVGNFTRTDVIAGGIALAASWDTRLARQAGTELGREARAQGVNFLLAPAVNICRSPLDGRDFEYFGEDPLLAARMAVGFITGVQSQGVAATIKHFFAYNSEFARHTTDVILDERAAREIYLPAFEAAVKIAHVAAVMDAYNLVDGEHMTQNRYFNVEVLKKEWGFKGILMSDWDATYDTLAAANGGLDLEMPAPKYFNRAALEPLLKSSRISMVTLDDKVRRILRIAVRFGWLERPQREISIPQFDARGRAVALRTALEGIVLLKNTHHLLPLDKRRLRSIAVIGPNAYPAVPIGGGSATVAPFHATSLLEGLGHALGRHVKLYYARGIGNMSQIAAATGFSTRARHGSPGLTVQVFDNFHLAGKPSRTRVALHVDEGKPLNLVPLVSGDRPLSAGLFSAMHPVSSRWTGYFTPKRPGIEDICIQVGGFGPNGYRLYVDGRLVADHWSRKTAMVEAFPLYMDAGPHQIILEHRQVAGGLDGRRPFVRLGIVPENDWVQPDAKRFAAMSDAVIIAVGFNADSEAEGWDRTFSLPPGQNELIRTLCAINARCIVILNSGGGVDMRSWLARVPGLIEAWYPGEAGGTALAQVLFGLADPSGRLPVTFDRSWKDNPAYHSYYPQPATHQVRYKEGVFIGYRGYEERGLKPLFPFGYGLSYTTFTYRSLKVRAVRHSSAALYEVSFTVRNTGTRAGAVVPQLYVAPPRSPIPRSPRVLKGFTRIELQPGESRKVVLPLDARAFEYYDVKAGCWRATRGTYRILIGESSEKVVLHTTVTLAHPILTRG